MRETSTLRRPLITFGTLLIALLVGVMAVQALAARSVFTARSEAREVAPGWIAVAVRAPESAGGSVVLVSVGGEQVRIRAWAAAGTAQLLNRNDATGLQRLAAAQTGEAVSGAVVLDRLALAGLIDAGATAGQQRATELVDAVLADPGGSRLLDVWRSVCRGLPADDARVRGVVVSLGSALRATEGANTVAHWLSEWRTGL